MDWKVEDQVIEHSELASVDEDESSETQSNGDNDNAEPTESERVTFISLNNYFNRKQQMLDF